MEVRGIKNIYLVFVAIAFFSWPGYAGDQAANGNEADNDTIESPWERGGRANLAFNQVALVNWAGGGQNSIAGGINGRFFLHYKNGNSRWRNTFDYGYGIMRQGENGIRKTDDKIELSSKYGKQAFLDNENWYYSTNLTFRTQANEGFNYPNDSVPVSNFMAPAYIMLAIGMDYSPNEYLSASLSPLTGKTTYVLDQELADKGSFGVAPADRDTSGNIITPGENVLYEFGGSLKILYEREIWDNVKLETKLELFSNYFEKPQNLVVNWDARIGMQVNKFLTVTLQTDVIYDEKVMIEVDRSGDGNIDGKGPRTQLKQVVGVGFTYQF